MFMQYIYLPTTVAILITGKCGRLDMHASNWLGVKVKFRHAREWLGLGFKVKVRNWHSLYVAPFLCILFYSSCVTI